jgi:hypothetical protein
VGSWVAQTEFARLLSAVVFLVIIEYRLELATEIADLQDLCTRVTGATGLDRLHKLPAKWHSLLSGQAQNGALPGSKRAACLPAATAKMPAKRRF